MRAQGVLAGAQGERWRGDQVGNGTVMLGRRRERLEKMYRKMESRGKVGGGDEWMADKRVKVAAEAAKPNVRTK